jgi:riboflavin kinase/FMN adenylyltransferase
MVKIQSNINLTDAQRPVLTIGMFDGVHKGHAGLLSHLVQQAREINGESIVLTFWPHPRIVLGQEPDQLKFLTTLDEKTRLISEADVDYIIILPFTTQLAGLSAEMFIKNYLVKKIGIKHLLVGYNHRFGNGGTSPQQLKNIAAKYNFNLSSYDPVTVNGMKPSSTSIRQLISDGDVWDASHLLGRFYSVKGQIIGGRRLGRQIGFPTSNIVLVDSIKLVPHDGVYAKSTY